MTRAIWKQTPQPASKYTVRRRRLREAIRVNRSHSAAINRNGEYAIIVQEKTPRLMKHWNPRCRPMTARIAARRVQTRTTGERIRMGSTLSVASALQERMRDSASVMCGRIQTANQVTIRFW